MKIDKFFRKQSKSLAEPAQLPDDGQATLDAGAKAALKKDGVNVKAEPNLVEPGAMDAAGSMDIDQAHKLKQHKVESSAGAPLAETTNHQQAILVAAPAAGTLAKQGANTAFASATIDLSGDSPQPASSAQPAAAAGVDAEDAVQLEQQQQAFQEQQAQANEATVEAMDVDEDGATAVAAEAAASSLPAAGAAAAGAEPATPAVAKVAGAGAATPGSALNTSTAKVPAEAFLTPEQRQQLLEGCLQEMPLLEAELGTRPDLAVELAKFLQAQAAAGKKALHLDLKAQVSVLVEGQPMTLTALAQHISSKLSGSSNSSAPTDGEASAAEGQADAPAAAAAAAAGAGGSDVAVTALAVRNIIQDVASRKSYGLQDGLLANVDALEDDAAEYHWCWELRTFAGLPKPVKQAADAARKRRKQVFERLKAAAAYVKQAQSFTKPTKTAESKLAKAAAKLAKLPALGSMEPAASAAATIASPVAAAAAVLAPVLQRASSAKVKADAAGAQIDRAAMDAAKQAGVEAEAASKAAAKAAKEAEAAAKQAEKEARAAAKAAEAEEKARAKAEADEKREEAKRLKAEEAARKASEAAKKKEEAAKKKAAAEAAKKGFHSMNEMQSAQAVFRNFFGMAPRRTPTPAGPSGDTSQGAGSQHEGSGQQQQQQQQQQQGSSKELGRMWAPAAEALSEQQVLLMQQIERELPYFNCSSTGTAAEDATAGSGASAAAAVPSAPELLATFVQRCKAVRQLNRKQWGLPPSWAQRPGAAEDPTFVTNTAIALYGAGVELQRLRCWRRKLIKHYDSVRPAFYGSMSQRSRSVRGRRPLGQEAELDYEVMSDQDWEEEPEGESLSDDGDDEEEAAATEGEEDEEGFVVGDGYLSDDEGMRDADEDAAADALAGGSADGSSPRQAALAQLEAGLERARQRGRPLVLVNSAVCPGMSWEPSSNLDPALLSSLKGSVLCPGIVLAPPTPAQLWHLYPAAATAAAAAAAGSTAAAAAGDATAAMTTAAGDAAAAAVGGAAAANGRASGRGRPASAFPDVLLSALVAHIQANSTQALDKLSASFVEAQAAAGFKLAKARVRDRIKEITTMKMIAKAPKYTVKPEFLQPGAAAAAAGMQDGAAAAGSPAPASPCVVAPTAAQEAGDVMQIDEAPTELQQQQLVQQQDVCQAATQSPAAAAAAPAAGVKRAAPADAASAPTEDAAAGAVAAAAAEPSKPPAKKQRTPGGGIERFFGKTPKQQQQQPAAQAQAQQGAQQQQQQQQQGAGQQYEAPPSTPRHQRATSPVDLAAADASAAAGDAAAAGAHAVHSSGGVLPMLTPPSHDVAADRPTVSNSPVPFRMNSAAGAEVQEAAAAERPPVNRWHAQANCRGMGLQGGDAGSMPGSQQPDDSQQQQQHDSQPFAGFDQPQQQQQQQQAQPEQQPADAGANAPAAAAAAAGAAALARAAAAARGTDGKHTGAAVAGSSGLGVGSFAAASSVREVPVLPADGSMPGYTFWKQLASWIINSREPDEQDIKAAFYVFEPEQHSQLAKYLRSMPQMVLTAMVKTLGSATQSFAMRSACALCISYCAHALAEQPRDEQQQQPADSTAADAAAPSSPQQQQATTPRTGSKCSAAAGGSPSPSSSPRSAPVEVSFEELCAEPGLLGNLLACMSPEKVLIAAKEAAPRGKPQPTHLQAAELARSAVRAVAAMLRVGLPNLVVAKPQQQWRPSAAAAAAQLRLQLASMNNWRGSLRNAVRDTGDRKRSSFALMSLWALAADPASAAKLTTGTRLPSVMLRAAADVATREWVLQKWGLLLASALLSEESIRQRALPQEAIQPLAAGADEAVQLLEGLGALAAAVLGSRVKFDLSQPGPDRTYVHKALSIVSLLQQVLDRQRELRGGALNHPRLAAIFGNDQVYSDLKAALEEVAMQEEWEEAAERARAILAAVSSAAAADAGNAEAEEGEEEGDEEGQGCEVEMQEA